MNRTSEYLQTKFVAFEPGLILIPFIMLVGSSFLMYLNGQIVDTNVGCAGVIFLMFLPALPQVHRTVRRKSVGYFEGAISSWIALCWLSISWLIWTWPNQLLPHTYEVLAWLEASCTVVLTGVILVVTQRLVSGDGDGEAVRDKIRQNPLLVLGSFLGYFLLITYFLAFALAFSQRADGEALGRGLHATDVSMPDQVGNRGIRMVRGLIGFERGSAKLWIDESSVSSEKDNDSSPVTTDMRASLKKHNAKILKQALDLSLQHDALERMRVTLIGFTTDEAVNPSTGYSSNFELAQARTLQVAHLIRRSLLKQEASALEGSRTEGGLPRYRDNFDWDLVPASSEANPDPDLDPAEGTDPRLSVQVEIVALPIHPSELMARSVEPRTLSLLDYFYFTIYTITTTGYGDIIPASSFAKLICAWANLLELFFLVVFFNVLVATVHHPGGPAERSPGDATKPPRAAGTAGEAG